MIQKVLCQIQWHLFLPHRRGEANYRIIKWLITCLAFISCKLYDHLMFFSGFKNGPDLILLLVTVLLLRPFCFQFYPCFNKFCFGASCGFDGSVFKVVLDFQFIKLYDVITCSTMHVFGSSRVAPI